MEIDSIFNELHKWKISFSAAGVTFDSILCDGNRQELLDLLNAIGLDNGGKIYLVQDPTNKYEKNGGAVRIDYLFSLYSDVHWEGATSLSEVADLGFIPKDAMVSFRNKEVPSIRFSKKIIDFNKKIFDILNTTTPTITYVVVGGGEVSYGLKLTLEFCENG